MRLVEWHVRLVVSPINETEEISRLTAEEILFESAVGWAECHRYGIGGGLDQNLENHWILDFGLCATRRKQLIPYADARGLVEYLQNFYSNKGVVIRGKAEPFAVDES